MDYRDREPWRLQDGAWLRQQWNAGRWGRVRVVAVLAGVGVGFALLVYVVVCR